MNKPLGKAIIGLLGSIVVLSVGGAASAAKPLACRSLVFPVYFPAGAATLTPAAARVIRSAAPRMAACRTEAITVSIRSDGKDAELNHRRAEVVSAALVEAGAPPRLAQVAERHAPFKLFHRRVMVSIKLLPD